MSPAIKNLRFRLCDVVTGGYECDGNLNLLRVTETVKVAHRAGRTTGWSFDHVAACHIVK